VEVEVVPHQQGTQRPASLRFQMMTQPILNYCKNDFVQPNRRGNNNLPDQAEELDESQLTFEDDFEDFFELYDNDNVVVVLPYDGDMDDRILEEMRPRFVIMYEPNPAFIRRVEVYRACHPNRHLKVYFLYYENSVEEQRYLSAVRKEKDAFTRLIREKGNMALVIQNDVAVEDPQEFFLRTINTRIAGGGRIAATAQPPRVIVDSREFRSSLPSLLHGRNLEVVPAMLTVGDYVLSPTMVVERKSVKDLIQSLNSGRLYNQCETMMQYYKTPLLLIEFDQNKSFNLEVYP
jgi:DNA excision repair protein ERCC-4